MAPTSIPASVPASGRASGPATGTVHRRRVLGSALVAAMAGLLGRWRKRAEAAPMAARRRGKRPPVTRPPIKWIGHM